MSGVVTIAKDKISRNDVLYWSGTSYWFFSLYIFKITPFTQ